MTRDEALVQMTMLWLEAEAKLKQSVPLADVEKLRDEIVSRAPAATEEVFDRFFTEVVGKSR
jgi:hypothetical protein